MLNEKKIKSLIVISLILIETFVWVVNGPNNFWSFGFFDRNGNPETIIGSSDEPGPGYEPPGDQNPPGTQEGDQPDTENGEQPEPGTGPDEEEPGAGYPPADNPDREQALAEANEKGLLILVNKEHFLDASYKPDDLRKIKYFVSDRSEAGRYMRAEAADAFHLLVDKAAEDGVELKMTTAYRSYDFQKILFDNYVAKEGEEQANTYSAKPGQSEHQTGLAVDVSSPIVDYQLSDDYGKTTEGKWLADHAYQFGFILRFPQGKEAITGYQYEPWHLRYVGLTAAKEIYEQGLTLEEYLQENNLE